ETFAKQQAIDEAAAAREAERAAELARRQEQQQKDKAVAAEKVAQKERNTAREAEKAAKNAEAQAVEAKALEEKQKTAAIESEKKAVDAQHSEEQAAYLTRIGMAAAKIEENAFDTATSLLDECKPENLRNWEWGYLKRLCGQGRDFPVTGTVNAVAFSPDEAWFVTAGQDQQAHFWDRNSGQRLSPIDHPAAIQAVAVSPDSQFLATGARDGMVRIYRVKDRTRLHELKGDGKLVLDVAFSPDGKWLLSTSASRDNSIRAWETATGRQLDLPLARGHLGWVWSARFSPDGKRFVSAGEDGKVIVWPFDPDWAPSAEKRLYEPQRELLGHTGPVFAAAFSPDGQYVASSGYDKRVLIWEPDAIKDISLTRLVDLGKPIPPQASQALEGHSAPVRTLAFSPKGEYLMTGSDDNTVRFWDVVTGRPHAQLRGHSRPVLSCAISSDGRQVLSGGQEGQIKLWDVVDYKEAPHGRAFEGHNDAVQAAAFSRDGTHIVTASRDHSARVYKIDSGKLLVELREGHKFLATNAVYFDDGRRLLSAAGDNTARIWDAATGSELHVFPNTGRSAAIAVSRDAKWILTGQYVSTIGENREPGEPLSAEKQDILRSSPQIAVWDL
ncbi:MAG: WD40 repeat domain-containing protein, partial [Pirellulales bacterium]